MSEHTTEVPEVRRLERSRTDRKIAGVSAGLARYFEIHPAVFRVGFVVLTLLGGAGILIYAAAAIVIPDEGKEDSIATAALRNRRERPWPLIGLGLLAVAVAIMLSNATLFWPDDDLWWLFLIAGGLILWLTRNHDARPTENATELAARDSRRVRRILAMFAILVASLVTLVLVAAAIFLAVFDVDGTIGDRTYTATRVENLRDEYRLGIGTMDVDLGDLVIPPGETHVDARVDVGDLLVIVPPGVALQIRGSAELGEVRLPNGIEADGRNVENEYIETGPRVLVVDAHVGAGSVRVERAVR